MKHVLNKGVRETIAEIEALADRYESQTTLLATPQTSFTVAVDTGFDRERTKELLCTAACRVLSHATRGRRFPNLTEGVYGQHW